MPCNHGPNKALNGTMDVEKDPTDIVETVKFCCGKACKSVNGFKMHQRGCRVLEGLNYDPLEIDNSNLENDSPLDDTELDNHVDISFDQQDVAVTKRSIM